MGQLDDAIAGASGSLSLASGSLRLNDRAGERFERAGGYDPSDKVPVRSVEGLTIDLEAVFRL